MNLTELDRARAAYETAAARAAAAYDAAVLAPTARNWARFERAERAEDAAARAEEREWEREVAGKRSAVLRSERPK